MQVSIKNSLAKCLFHFSKLPFPSLTGFIQYFDMKSLIKK